MFRNALLTKSEQFKKDRKKARELKRAAKAAKDAEKATAKAAKDAEKATAKAAKGTGLKKKSKHIKKTKVKMPEFFVFARHNAAILAEQQRGAQ